MSKENPIELTSCSSRESLGESSEAAAQQQQQHRESSEIDWKKSTSTARNEIEISGSKEEAAAAVAAAAGTSSMARDVRRLKSATLDRMGKMLRIHSKSSGEKPDETAGAEGSEEVTRKQKFNSLTRMLRLTDRDDNSKSLGQDRGRSLSRILRRKAPIEGDNPSDKAEDHVPGIFSRILGQFRGRIFKTDSLSKDEASKVAEQSNLSKSPSDPTLSELNLETSSPVMQNIRYEA